MEEFDSLSPIYFRTLSELSVKLAALAPKFIKGKRATSDTSQANKQYTASGSYEGVRFRSFVEHGRLSILPQMHVQLDLNVYISVFSGESCNNKTPTTKNSDCGTSHGSHP